MRIIKEQEEIDGRIENVTLKFNGLRSNQEFMEIFADRIIEIMKENGEL